MVGNWNSDRCSSWKTRVEVGLARSKSLPVRHLRSLSSLIHFIMRICPNTCRRLIKVFSKEVAIELIILDFAAEVALWRYCRRNCSTREYNWISHGWFKSKHVHTFKCTVFIDLTMQKNISATRKSAGFLTGRRYSVRELHIQVHGTWHKFVVVNVPVNVIFTATFTAKVVAIAIVTVSRH